MTMGRAMRDIKPTKKIVKLLKQNRLGHVLVGDQTYVPNCTLEGKKRKHHVFVKIRNADGVVIAKTEGVPFPKPWVPDFECKTMEG
ncbi:MAG: hypothetical protein DRP56_02775 [Planctomycetota bacterium]|nr:MAG: hypothetical protein DRP56_02775 [Planctomycetota bacterium]